MYVHSVATGARILTAIPEHDVVRYGGGRGS